VRRQRSSTDQRITTLPSGSWRKVCWQALFGNPSLDVATDASSDALVRSNGIKAANDNDQIDANAMRKAA
jgi:hypothetical protein